MYDMFAVLLIIITKQYLSGDSYENCLALENLALRALGLFRGDDVESLALAIFLLL